MANFISAKYLRTDFPKDYSKWTLEDEIKVFEDKVYSWQINIADSMLNSNIPEMRHSGFAALSVMLSYFEMIGKYIHGYIPKDKTKPKSRKYFTKGINEVYPLKHFSVEQLDLIYESARCGLYHLGMTQRGISISGGYREAISFEMGICRMNPHILVKDLYKHFGRYIRDLRSNTKLKLRNNFQKRFDYDER